MSSNENVTTDTQAKTRQLEMFQNCLSGCAFIVISLGVLGAREIAKNTRRNFNLWKFERSKQQKSR